MNHLPAYTADPEPVYTLVRVPIRLAPAAERVLCELASVAEFWSHPPTAVSQCFKVECAPRVDPEVVRFAVRQRLGLVGE